MKKYLILLVPMIALSVAVTASAQGAAAQIKNGQGNSTTTKPQAAKVLNAAEQKTGKTFRTYVLTIRELESIAARIQTRIDKAKAKGIDTASSELYLSAATKDLSEAKAKIVAFTSLDLTGTKMADNMKKIRAAAVEAKVFIKEAHQNLMLSVRALNMAGGAKDATSTDAR